jgi:rhamnose utilization protein RhaD (predicted bifunctional aldolase and dehydrogenase)
MFHSGEPNQSLAVELAELSRQLGLEARDWAAVAEGNVSTRLDDDSMLVKASGSRMRTAATADFVQLRLANLVDVLDDAGAGDDEVRAAFDDGLVGPTGNRPSVESLLHAVCLTDGHARVVGHSHPAAVNAFLCSSRPETLVEGSLFPDQIVVLGRHQLLVPYVDPGLPLARLVRAELRNFVQRHNAAPKVIYLANHGLFALGGSVQEVLDITEMAAKTARILLGTVSAGGPSYLSPADCDRIDTRPDEVHRRQVLSGAAQGD